MNESPSLPKLYSEADAATYLKVADVTLRRFRRAGKIGYIRIGKAAMYTEHHLLKYLEQQTVRPSAAPKASVQSASKPGSIKRARGQSYKDASEALRLAHQTILLAQKSK